MLDLVDGTPPEEGEYRISFFTAGPRFSTEVDVLSLEAFNGERWQTGRAEQSPNLFFFSEKIIIFGKYLGFSGETLPSKNFSSADLASLVRDGLK